ncbi:hypothetical protein FM106_09865 [Brachybacterium faecium]|nr:hypothetical protein FM106_09865 [Brachybacterium faecium]
MASAEESQSRMCRSVPQMPARSTRTFTSHGPHPGSSTFVHSKPAPGATLRSARISTTPPLAPVERMARCVAGGSAADRRTEDTARSESRHIRTDEEGPDR